MGMHSTPWIPARGVLEIARIESMCIILGEAAIFVGGKVFEKPATSATPALTFDDSVALFEGMDGAHMVPGSVLELRGGAEHVCEPAIRSQSDDELLCDYSEGRRSCQGVVRVRILS